jgi:voltage-gated potassium channel
MLDRWKYTVLLAALLALVVGYPVVKGGHEIRLLYTGLLATVFVAAQLVLFQRRSMRLAATLLGGWAVAGVLLHDTLPRTPPVVDGILFHLLPAAFLLLLVTAILHTLFDQKQMTADGINAAFAGYLLIGLTFAHLYCVVEITSPGSFRVAGKAGPLESSSHLHFVLVYFSLITLTTVGYGDITPGSDATRALAMFEAMVGQFYVAVVMAELLALKVATALRDREKQDAGAGP